MLTRLWSLPASLCQYSSAEQADVKVKSQIESLTSAHTALQQKEKRLLTRQAELNEVQRCQATRERHPSSP